MTSASAGPRGGAGDGAALRRFLDAVAAGACPYLAPARAHAVLDVRWHGLADLTAAGAGDPVGGLFHLGVVAAEDVRRRRTALAAAGDVGAARLLCVNLALAGSRQWDPESAHDLVAWPHLLLKDLYAEVGLMIGKFWTGECGRDRAGRPLPHPPVTLLSIRSAVRRRDPGLLRRTPRYAGLVAAAQDDGRDVLAARTGVPGAAANVPRLRAAAAYGRLRAASREDGR